MSPTIHKEKGYRFFFFSREEPRMHVHVYWLEPQLELARNYRLSRTQLGEIEQIIEAHHDEFASAWKRHLSG
jgi:hypothetical protein